MSAEKIINYIDELDEETKAIRSDVLKFCWYMRGGLNYEEAMYLSPSERKIIGQLISDNLETTKKSGLPFF